MAARSSLLRRAFRHASSVVAALAALAPRLVRLARHHYPDGLLEVRGVERLAHLAHAQAAAEVGEAARGERAQARAGEPLDGDRQAGAVAREVARLERRDAERQVAHPAHVDAAALDGAVEVRE